LSDARTLPRRHRLLHRGNELRQREGFRQERELLVLRQAPLQGDALWRMPRDPMKSAARQRTLRSIPAPHSLLKSRLLAKRRNVRAIDESFRSFVRLQFSKVQGRVNVTLPDLARQFVDQLHTISIGIV